MNDDDACSISTLTTMFTEGVLNNPNPEAIDSEVAKLLEIAMSVMREEESEPKPEPEPRVAFGSNARRI